MSPQNAYSDLEVASNPPKFHAPDSEQPIPAHSEELYPQLKPGYEQWQKDDSSKYFQIRKTTFWLSLLVGFLILAGLIGGIVGGLQSKMNSSNNISTPTAIPTATPINITNTGSSASSNTFTSTSTTSSLLPSGTAGVKAECPGTDKTNFTVAQTGQKFYRECEINYSTNDIQTQYAATMTDCITACVNWNSKAGQTSPCVGVVWTYAGQDAGTCWFKSKMINRGLVPLGTESATLLS